MSEPDRRDQLLLKMYDQMFSDINRHILVVWQSVGVLVGAFAIFALTEKRIITIDVATALVVLLAAWLEGAWNGSVASGFDCNRYLFRLLGGYV